MSTSRCRWCCCCCALALALLLGAPQSRAYETDQYSNRASPVADSLTHMDEQVNLVIARILNRKRAPQTEKAFARALYHGLGSWHWVDKIESWAAKSHVVEKYPQTRRDSIYKAMPFWATRVNYVFGVGRTFRVNDVMVGSDKFGHFISQGYKYFLRELRYRTETEIIAQGAAAEYWLFGKITTGAYSNADLVANYEGWRFYQSLFRDNVIDGKPALLTRRAGRLVQQRPFTWADHINDYWDEALNPSSNVRALNGRLRKAIRTLCDDYHRQPAFYTASDDAALWQKYRHIGLRDTRENQFSAICDSGADNNDAR